MSKTKLQLEEENRGLKARLTLVDQVEAVMDAAIKAARAKAKEEGLVEKGGDLKVVVNLAFSVPAHKRWLAFGSRIPAPCPVILRGSLRESADEAEASR